MSVIYETAPAKINLYLHVGPLRTDGLHDLASLFVFTEDGDEIIAEPADALTLDIEGPFAGALAGDQVRDNLVYRAAEALRRHAGIDAGARLRLVKNLPVAAGIGGGSADAAAALRALRKLWNAAITDAQMHGLAFELGADVPACLQRQPVFVDGAGETLSPAPPLPQLWVLLVNPGVELSTGEVFRRFDEDNRNATAPAHPAAPEGTIAGLGRMMAASRNDLEAPARALAPAIAALLCEMQSTPGVLVSRMSGSGATCFALFDNATAAETACNYFREKQYWAMATTLVSGQASG